MAALSDVERIGKGGGDRLRPNIIFGAFIDGPELSLENMGRDILLVLGSPLSDYNGEPSFFFKIKFTLHIK